MRYILFEKSAVEKLINEPMMQSIEFDLSKLFVSCLKQNTVFQFNGIECDISKDGIIFVGERIDKTFLVIDLEQCNIIEKTTDQELLVVLQKTFRFSVRFWNRQAFTNCEKIFKDKTVIFPFPFSTGAMERIVIARNPSERRLLARGISNSLLAYKYGEEGASSSADEKPSLEIFRKAGEYFIDNYFAFKQKFAEKNNQLERLNQKAIYLVESERMRTDDTFKYLSYEQQIFGLTNSQRKIVECEDLYAPIRIEGPAGTGKTVAMILRAVKILNDATEKQEPIVISFFTHSKSTEKSVRMMLVRMLDSKWLDPNNPQRIFIVTLQDYCVKYIDLKNTQIIDLDAAEAKQYQLLLIQEAFDKIKGSVFSTFKPLMSQDAISYFEKEEENKIILMLQYEFSIHIKGVSEGDLESYKKIKPIKNGIPFKNEMDKEFVYRIFTEYQQYLESQSVYDTDDIILESLARLNAPLWRRTRMQKGVDYIFVDEMHLFNLNEQQIFHYLTKDVEQKKIPICFALDYGQVIGERGKIDTNNIENSICKYAISQELETVFRSSPQIAELCASITASGAILFDNFVNPYKYCESGFTAKEEDLCEVPELYMYENDGDLRKSLENHIKEVTSKLKCRMNEVAVIFFDEEMFEEYFKEKIGKYEIDFINGRVTAGEYNSNKVICSLPEYINGLEFECVIMVGIDQGRVPQSGVYDISSNFLKYSALNKLYLACSRARFNVRMLGTKSRGISSCLKHSIENKTINVINQ